MTPTSKIGTLPSLRLLSQKHLVLVLLIFISACSPDQVPEESNLNSNLELNGDESIYKGVFATRNSHVRGVFKLILPGGAKDFNKLNRNAVGTLTLQTGEIVTAQAVELFQKSSTHNFKILFESNDLSFYFTLDENDQPLVTEVAYKEEASSIIAAEHTEDSPVTPITGTYKCTNCQDQNSTVEGIELDNSDRTFNMLLTTEDGSTNVSIQAFVGILVDTNLLVNESCTTNEQYTFCMIKNGEMSTREPLSWSGVHRYTSEESENKCSTISGVFEYSSALLGAIKGEFKSDSNCPNTTYFVSPAGEDTNTGLSPQDAWKSIAKVNSLNIQPGDVILFEGGESFPGSITLNENDGNNGANPVKISSYGTGRATIQPGDEMGIFAYNTSGFIIDNLIIAGSGMNSNTNSGIYFYNDLPNNKKLDFIEITNCEVHGFRENGIVIGGWNGNAGFSNVIIENNKVYNILDKGIFSYGEFSSTKTGYAHSNITVRNCEVFNILGYSKKEHSGNGIVLSDVQHSVIEHSTVYDSGSGNTNCGGPVGIWYWDADQVTIQFSEVYNMSSGTGCDGGGFDMDGGVTNGVMQYNYSHDNDGAGFLIGQFTGARPMNNITVRYNISQNDAATNGGSVYLFNGNNSASSLKDVYVYNNTLYLSQKATNRGSATVKYITWKTVKDNINFYNNILYATNGAALIDIPSGYEGNFRGNLYFTPETFVIKYNGQTYNSLDSFRSSGNEIHDNQLVGYQGEPNLNHAGQGGIIGFGNQLSTLNAYRLQVESAAINGGINIPFNTGGRDYYGQIFTDSESRDIGAYKKI